MGRPLGVRIVVMVFSLLVAVVGLAAPDAGAQGAKSFGNETLKFAPQFGMAYLPHFVMIEKKLLEKHLPGIKVTQIRISGGGGVTEQLLSGNMDIGYMGMAPYLKAWDKGVDVKIALALEAMPMKLVIWKSEYTTLKDIGPNDKIAMPGLTSFQNTVLAIAAHHELGNAKALAKNAVGLAHPDAEIALRGKKEIIGHFGQLPFQRREAALPGFKVLLNSYDTLGGPHTLIVAVTTAKLYRERPEVYAGFVRALTEAIEFIKTRPEEAAEVMATTGDKSPKADLVADMKSPEVIWSPVPTGMVNLAKGMHATAQITRTLGDWREITFPNLHDKPAN